MIAVDLGAVARSCYDPVSHLVHVTGRDQVTDVWSPAVASWPNAG